ncbi:cytochrome b/b6 domain-containing protein [Reinekea marinisedimentorum]|uniref:Thiosulfate reductase cytochrome b subunit n=1 Tax=Reinekea marinisedimentorum TaxID=230495 RepID=A0A4R3I8F2_9GAMM|nr:cytochrome b/b6 domain-containing protein [Reinekea marinisedimentorum]TCS41601.1 thiosulfate reductase cytochrome b subunit [Reinekea marinisedimentorum]
MSEAKRIYLFKRFERIWHWSQAVLIILMMLTGFEIHGLYSLFGFAKAVDIHSTSAWILMVLWVLSIFWHFTTGEFRHYLPSMKGVIPQVQYYLVGIFSGAEKPFHATEQAKHNPLQRLAYLGVSAFLLPLVWISGLGYLFYNELADSWLQSLGLGLSEIALIHTVAAFLVLIFLVAHLYLITTGKTVGQHTRSMITGWEEVSEEESIKN